MERFGVCFVWLKLAFSVWASDVWLWLVLLTVWVGWVGCCVWVEYISCGVGNSVAKEVVGDGTLVEGGAFRWSPGGEALMVSPGILCKRRGSCVGIGVGRLQHLSFAYGLPLHYSVRLLAA